jgi:hypothetical protein
VYGKSLDEIYDAICMAVKASGFDVGLVVCGMAPGVDLLGRCWARDNKIPWKEFPPDWNGDGKSAGIKRNILMGEHADACIAIWDQKSKGTGHMVGYAKKRGLPVYVHDVG